MTGQGFRVELGRWIGIFVNRSAKMCAAVLRGVRAVVIGRKLNSDLPNILIIHRVSSGPLPVFLSCFLMLISFPPLPA